MTHATRNDGSPCGRGPGLIEGRAEFEDAGADGFDRDGEREGGGFVDEKDDAVEFARLDKNKDGFIDKGEAAMEPKLLGKWVEVDTNKDGKISKEEFLAFERKEHTAKKQ